jgi:AcrR family transcriptional regulator
MPAAPAAAPAPRFRRPTPADAVDVARELLDESERVDIQAVARRLGVSRATVHRWFGTRDQLLSALFDHLAVEFTRAAESAARGAGDDRVFDFVRRIAEASSGYAPLRLAAEREPALVLRLVLAEDGPVHGQVAAAVARLLAATRTPQEMRRIAETVETFTAATVALHWATIAAGGDPDPRRYEEIGRALFAVAPAPRQRRR